MKNSNSTKIPAEAQQSQPFQDFTLSNQEPEKIIEPITPFYQKAEDS
jgi:hypothetical protein